MRAVYLNVLVLFQRLSVRCPFMANVLLLVFLLYENAVHEHNSFQYYY